LIYPKGISGDSLNKPSTIPVTIDEINRFLEKFHVISVVFLYLDTACSENIICAHMNANAEKPKAYIITDETEAIRHYRELLACGFEVRLRGKILSIEEFVAIAETGGNVDVFLTSTFQQDNDEGLGLPVEISPEEAAGVYQEAWEMGYSIHEPGVILDEAGFVEVAARGGRVDLRRVRSDSTVGRYFGSTIGYSRTKTLEFPISQNRNAYLQ
jgi:hypothetical protein